MSLEDIITTFWVQSNLDYSNSSQKGKWKMAKIRTAMEAKAYSVLNNKHFSHLQKAIQRYVNIQKTVTKQCFTVEKFVILVQKVCRL